MNLRPPRPERGALPSCATSRGVCCCARGRAVRACDALRGGYGHAGPCCGLQGPVRAAEGRARLVGVPGLEPGAFRSQSGRATKLRYTPWDVPGGPRARFYRSPGGVRRWRCPRPAWCVSPCFSAGRSVVLTCLRGRRGVVVPRVLVRACSLVLGSVHRWCRLLCCWCRCRACLLGGSGGDTAGVAAAPGGC